MTDPQAADFELGAGIHHVVITAAGIVVTKKRGIHLDLRLRGAKGFAAVWLLLSHPAAAPGVLQRDLALVATLVRLANSPAPIHDELDLAPALTGIDFTAELVANPKMGLRLNGVAPAPATTDA